VKENRDFILSLDPDLVYLVSQLWHSLDERDFTQWEHTLGELSQKYDASCDGEIREKRKEWLELQKKYEVLSSQSHVD
jgi:hypothetical protein